MNGIAARPARDVPALRAEGLTRRYGSSLALDGASLSVHPGQVSAVLGPSGSGKSTLLRLVAGLEPSDGGRVEIGGRDVTRLPAHRRGVGLVFQDHALFPHLNVHDNVAFGLVEARWARERRDGRVLELLEDLGLRTLAARRVDALSGGERQRVALARALAPRPTVLLLDEPLASLDRGLRERLAEDLAQRLRQPGLASLLVTHDLDEAATVADTLVLLRDGRVVQSGPVATLVGDPVDAWVARFVGHPNVFEGRERERLPSVPTAPRPRARGGDGAHAVWLRDDLVRLMPEPTDRGGGSDRLEARLLQVRPQRGGLRLELHVPAWDVRVVWRGAVREVPRDLGAGTRLWLEVPTDAWRRLPLRTDSAPVEPPPATRDRSANAAGAMP